VTEIRYPAITICNPKSHDTGEYVQSVFNNFNITGLKNKNYPFMRYVEVRTSTPLLSWMM
jgi:hypothetical protein